MEGFRNAVSDGIVRIRAFIALAPFKDIDLIEKLINLMMKVRDPEKRNNELQAKLIVRNVQGQDEEQFIDNLTEIYHNIVYRLKFASDPKSVKSYSSKDVIKMLAIFIRLIDNVDYRTAYNDAIQVYFVSNR